MDYGHAETDKELKALEEKVRKEYERAATDMNKKASDYLEKYKKKDDAKKRQLKNGEITKQEYQQWKVGQLAIGKRWNEMRDTLYQDLNNAHNIAKSMTTEFTYDVYALNHNYGTFEVESGSLMDTSYTLYDRDSVYTLIKDQPKLLPKWDESRQAIARDKRWDLAKFDSAITQGILQGESMKGIAKRLSSVADLKRGQDIRIARTMTTSAENLGRKNSYERASSMGIKVKNQWIATLDSRTRDSHRMVDGEVRKIDEEFSNGLMFPGDPDGEPEEVYNCRCTLIAVIDGIDYDLADVSHLNGKLGSESYDEWRNDKGESLDSTIISFNNGDDANKYFGQRPDRSLRRENKELYEQKRNEYKESMFGKWNDGLSSDQTSAIGYYSGDDYSGINGLLRHQMTKKMVDDWNSYSAMSIENMISNIESAIDSFELVDSIKVYRTCENDVLENLKLSVGSIFHDDGFCSTSILPNKVASGNIVMEINVPAGKGLGAWINPLSGAEDKEWEFLLQRGSDFEITEILTVGDDTIVRMNLIGNTKTPWSYASKEEVVDLWKRKGIYDEFNEGKI